MHNEPFPRLVARLRLWPPFSARLFGVGALGVAALANLPGCGGSDAEDSSASNAGSNQPSEGQGTEPRDESDTEGLSLCCQLGAICHPDSEDPPGGIVRLCHELGHANRPDECRAQFDDCMAACDPEDAQPEHACL